ncbi:MAG: hypothetical protein LBG57_14790 [Treponema sp.]|nr:hypothetical protein [Treponema sp.]
MKIHREGRRAPALRLLILIPHRDARLPLRFYSASLFAAGFCGAWSFPWAAPLAILSRSFSAAELKHCAHALREQSIAGGGDGKIKTGPAARAVFPESVLANAAVFGPALDIALPDAAFTLEAAAKITYRFSPLVLGVALTRSSETAAPEAPALSFRAAALANMVYRPLSATAGALDSPPPEDAYSFEWKIGESRWLPPFGKKG